MHEIDELDKWTIVVWISVWSIDIHPNPFICFGISSLAAWNIK